MPITNLNLSQANSVSLNTLSSNNLYFDGVDYYTATSINGVEYLNKLILKQNVPFYNFVYSTGSTLSISNVNTLNYLVVNTNVDTFSANFGSFTLGLSNIYVSDNFNNCQLRVNLGPGLSCNKTNIFVTTDAVLSSNTNQFYTFSYYNTGSLILGFSLSGVPQPVTTPPIPNFPTQTPTPSITPTITPTRTVTPTITPTITNIGNKDISVFGLTDLALQGFKFRTSASPVLFDYSSTPIILKDYNTLGTFYYTISANENIFDEVLELLPFQYGSVGELVGYELNYYRLVFSPFQEQYIRLAVNLNNRTSLNIPVTGWTLNNNTSGSLIFYKITPTPTPSPTITPSITPTISITPSITKTPSRTPTITPTISLTPSITPTKTLTPTPSLTPGFPPLPSSIVVNGLTLNPGTIQNFYYDVNPQSIYSNNQDCEFTSPCYFNLFFNPVNQDITGGVGLPVYLSGGRWYYVNGGCSDSGCGITTVISNSGADQAYYVLPVTGWAGNITVAYPTPTPSPT